MTDKSKKNVSEAEKQIDFGFIKVEEAKKEEKVREVFDSVAPKYDLMNDILSFGMHRGWKHRCIREAEVTRGMKLLDIGPVIWQLLLHIGQMQKILPLPISTMKCSAMAVNVWNN